MEKLVTTLFLIFATAVWAGDYEARMTTYEKGDFITAASLFKKAAEQGDSYAQNNLALMYNEGKGVLKRRCRSSSLVQVGS